MQEAEVDALFLGVTQLLDPGRRLRLGAPVDAAHRRYPEAFGDPQAIHRRVAGADHHDARAQADRGSPVGELVTAHEVDPGQKLVGRVDPPRELAGDAEEGWRAGAGGHEDGIETLVAEQLRDGEGLADHLVGLEPDACVAQPLNLAPDDLAGQPEGRDAVLEDPADHVQRLVDGDVSAEAGQVGGRAQAARTRADDRHRAQLARKRRRSGLGRPGVVADVAFQPSDRHRLHPARDHALRLALQLLRTDPSADRREDAGLVDRVDGGVDVAEQQVADEARDVDGHRATGDAGRLAALDAALGLLEGVLHGVTEIDLFEVGGPLRRATLRHPVLAGGQLGDLLVGPPTLDDQLLLDVAEVGKVLVGPRLLVLEALLPGIQLGEVHLMAIEIGAVDADELDLPSHRDPAGAAHAGAVDHDGVERHLGGDSKGTRGLDAGAHHRQRTDGDDQVGPVGDQHLAKRLGDQTRTAMAGVVGAHDQLVALSSEPLFPEHPVAGAEAHDPGGAIAGRLEGPELRVDRRHSETAAHHRHVTNLLNELGQAERTHEVVEAVPLPVVVAHLPGRLAQRLDDDGDDAALAVEVGDRQRDALTALVQPGHDEMPRLRGAGDVGRQDIPAKRRLREELAANDGVHARLSDGRRRDLAWSPPPSAWPSRHGRDRGSSDRLGRGPNRHPDQVTPGEPSIPGCRCAEAWAAPSTGW